MDVGEILLTGGLGVAGALGGVLLSDYLAGRRATQERTTSERRDAAGRVREAVLVALSDTREVLMAQLDWLEDAVARRETAQADFFRGRTRFNIYLVGDVETIRHYGELVQELLTKVPLTWFDVVKGARLPPIVRPSIDPDLIERINRVRVEMLNSLDRQEGRAQNDEPIVRLSAADLEDVPLADALLAQLRRRRREKNQRGSPAKS